MVKNDIGVRPMIHTLEGETRLNLMTTSRTTSTEVSPNVWHTHHQIERSLPSG